MTRPEPRSSLVYSTDAGRICPGCRQPTTSCRCGEVRPVASADGVVRVAVETKGRNGKAVTTVKGLALDEAALAALGKTLRTACGCGGTAKNGVIELQGDHAARAAEALQRDGWKVKTAGK